MENINSVFQIPKPKTEPNKFRFFQTEPNFTEIHKNRTELKILVRFSSVFRFELNNEHP